MRHLVVSSAKESQAGEQIGGRAVPFKYRDWKRAFLLRSCFLIDGIQYRYGFEATRKQVISEWLFSVPSTKEASLFVREADEIKPSPRFFKEGKALENKTRSNALFLSVVAQFNAKSPNQ